MGHSHRSTHHYGMHYATKMPPQHMLRRSRHTRPSTTRKIRRNTRSSRKLLQNARTRTTHQNGANGIQKRQPNDRTHRHPETKRQHISLQSKNARPLKNTHRTKTTARRPPISTHTTRTRTRNCPRPQTDRTRKTNHRRQRKNQSQRRTTHL